MRRRSNSYRWFRVLAAAGVLALAQGAFADNVQDLLSQTNARKPVDEIKVREVRISMGNVAPPGAYPFQVLLNTRKKSGKTYMCGGSLIADGSWVLTAAHCMMEDDGSVMVPFQVTVFAGSNDYGGGNAVLARQVFVNPAYKPGVFDNDVALIRLRSRPWGIRYATIPILDPAREDELAKPDTRVTVIGWGNMESGETADRLMVGRPRLIDRAQCNANYLDYYFAQFNEYVNNLGRAGRDAKREELFFFQMRLDNQARAGLHELLAKGAPPAQTMDYARQKAGAVVTENMICALGSPPNFGETMVTDACHGDSGGPLFVTDQRRPPVVIGVVSWGEGGKLGCGDPKVPGIYTRLTKMRAWIDEVMAR